MNKAGYRALAPKVIMILFFVGFLLYPILQAWALQKAVREMGYDAEHIDYKPSKKEKILNLIKSGNSPRLILEGLRKRAVKAGNQGARKKAESFAPFYKKQMILSPVCEDHAALKKQAALYDVLLCGSDQQLSGSFYTILC